MKKYFFISALMAGVILLFSTCRKEEENDEYTYNTFIQDVLKNEKWYLWYNTVPNVNPKQNISPEDYLDLLRNTQDKWSYTSTVQQHNSYYAEGKYVGLGFGYTVDAQHKFRVNYVFHQSPAYEAGMRRGTEIYSLNNKKMTEYTSFQAVSEAMGPATEGLVLQMQLVNNNTDTFTVSLTKRIVTQNTVLHSQIIEKDGVKAGYLVLKGFIGPTKDELSQAFSEFQSGGVKNVIIDLRYNGGGRLDVSNYLANLIAGGTANGKVYQGISHNDTKTSYDTSFVFKQEAFTLNAEHLVVLTSRGTASASECLINGLKPHMDVKLIGDNTHGKPVGMYSFSVDNFVLVPICFRLVNSEGYGEYFDGLPADALRADGPEFPFGDVNEPALGEAMYYLIHGSFSNLPVKMQSIGLQEYRKGLEAEIGAW